MHPVLGPGLRELSLLMIFLNLLIIFLSLYHKRNVTNVNLHIWALSTFLSYKKKEEGMLPIQTPGLGLFLEIYRFLFIHYNFLRLMGIQNDWLWLWNVLFIKKIVQAQIFEFYTCLLQILEAVLPKGMIIPSAFETVGHIAHLNLRDEHLPYKKVIAQVLNSCSSNVVTTMLFSY